MPNILQELGRQPSGLANKSNIRVAQKLQFWNNFRLKTQNAKHFARTWTTSNRVGEQVQY
jgi:hypothetical protein